MVDSTHFRFSEELNRKCIFFLNPQSLRDSPGGARGKDSPNPFGRFALRTVYSTPSHFVTAPVGHGERIPRNPFGRFAPSGEDYIWITCNTNEMAILN